MKNLLEKLMQWKVLKRWKKKKERIKTNNKVQVKNNWKLVKKRKKKFNKN